MHPDRWEAAKRLFHEALERPASERARFVTDAAAGDAELRDEVIALLTAQTQADAIFGDVGQSDAAQGLPPGTRFGPYEIHQLIGAGGMGEVYHARDTKLRRDVAIKILPPSVAHDPERRQRFEREAHLLASLNHPHIAAIYGFEEAAGIAALVLELVEGPTLADRVASGPIPVDEALAIARQIADAVEAAHERGVVHRDLKPANVKLTPEGIVKVLDFGLAKAAAIEGDLTQAPTIGAIATREGVIAGTAPYMSPEQARGKTVDKRADIWAFGCVLYELLTGAHAFPGETLTDALAAVVNREPDWSALPATTPAGIRRLLRRCLEKDPKRRLRDIGDARIEIEEIASSTAEPSAAPPAASIEQRAGSTATRLLRMAVLAAVVAAASVATYVLGRSSRPPLPIFHQMTFRHGNISGARLAPDGETIIYQATWTSAEPDLYVIRPESPQSGSLGLSHAGIFSISSRGEMAIALGCRLNWGECIGTLAEVPLTGGTPREIMKDVFAADWDPDGRNLAVVAFVGGVYRLEYPQGKVLYETPGWITYARVSPAGDAVAFIDHPTLGDIGGSVSLVQADGTRTTLSSGWKSLQGLAWSPRGDEIWFTGSRVSRGGSLAIYAVTRSGKEREIFSSPGTLKLYDIARNSQRVLLLRGTPRSGVMIRAPNVEAEREFSWLDSTTVADLSNDGKTLLFYEWGEGVAGTATVYLRQADGSPAIRLGEGKPLALSPDGRWALAVEQTSPPQLVLLPTGPGEVKRLPRGAISEYLDWAAWSPDGRRIFFAAQESEERRRTYVQSIDGGEPRPVTPDGFVGTLLSSDGTHIAAVDRYGEYYLCEVAGGDPRAVDGYVDGDTLLQWSADGRFLFVREAGNLVVRIFKLDVSSGRREFWKELTPPASADLIDVGSDPGEVRVTPDGQSYAYTYSTFAGELYLAEGLR